jgi:predicted NAD/FAD-dependent oxidoreductase
MRRKSKKLAIIGAGMTAAACVRILSKSGAEIDVFEKSRGAGGRMATRRLTDTLTADHGAQYFTSETPEFDIFITEMIGHSAIAEWPVRQDRVCYVGTPHMNTPIKGAMANIELHANHLVSKIERRDNQWWLTVNDTLRGPYDFVVSTIPAPQAQVITSDTGDGFDKALGRVKIAPSWALMLIFKEALRTDLMSWRSEHLILGWIGRNSSKAGRESRGDSWTVHATPEWSEAFLEISKEEAAKKLFEAFAEIIPVDSELVIKTAHRWRYAQTIKPLGKPYVSDASNTLFVGGDWCLGARVEYAFHSGTAIANAILDQHG